MQCGIEILGIQAVRTSATDSRLNQVVVTIDPWGCEFAAVRVRSSTAVSAWRPASNVNGSWQASFDVAHGDLDSSFLCGSSLTVEAKCTDKQCDPATRTFTVVQCCPSVDLQAKPATDCENGVRAVTLIAQVHNAPDGAQFQWSFSDDDSVTMPETIPTGGGPITRTHNYAPGNYTASFTVLINRISCPAVTTPVNVPICCPGNIQLEVTDSQGNVIPDDACVGPKTYMVTAKGSNLEGADLSWSVDGNDRGTHDTSILVDVSDLGLCDGPVARTILFSAQQKGCKDQSKTRTLVLCPENRFCLPCWILQCLILFCLSVTVLGVVLLLCPQVGMNYSLARLGDKAAVFFANLAIALHIAGPLVGLLAFVVGAVLFIIWLWKCNYSLCNDALVITWQALLCTAYVLIYFGTCPGCIPFLVAGAVFAIVGIGFVFYWVIKCRPSSCRVWFAILNLSLAREFASWLDLVFNQCVWPLGVLMAALWGTFLGFSVCFTFAKCRFRPS